MVGHATEPSPLDSDTEGSTIVSTNRGNKLQRRAKHAQHGRLDTAGGPLPHRHPVEHAGYTRHVISINPPLYDDDGGQHSAGESDVEQLAAPVAENPYEGIQLEKLLKPLTSAAELPDHPALSVAYTSKALTQMVNDVLEMVRHEKASLWKAKRLLQRFRGDADWVPCGVIEAEQGDMAMLMEDLPAGEDEADTLVETPDVESAWGEGVEMGAGPGVGESGESKTGGEHRDVVEDSHAARQSGAPLPTTDEQPACQIAGAESVSTAGDNTKAHGHDRATSDTKGEDSLTAPHLSPTDGPRSDQPTQPAEALSETTHPSGQGQPPVCDAGPSHAMTTRARARSPARSPAASAPPSDDDDASVPAVHPWFRVPARVLPDRDLGLPAREAENVRKHLFQYVQKQENIVRELETLATGLQRADRLRRNVWRACRAEAHLVDDGHGARVSALSDGEDWCDIEEWGLTRDDLTLGKDGEWGLAKGKDEVEDAEDDGRRSGRRAGGRRVARI